MSYVVLGQQLIYAGNVATVFIDHVDTGFLAGGLQRKHPGPPVQGGVQRAAQYINMDRYPFVHDSFERTNLTNDRHKPAIVEPSTVLEIRLDDMAIVGSTMQMPIFVSRRHQQFIVSDAKQRTRPKMNHVTINDLK